MNNTFNINRLGSLLKRQWLDFGKIYLVSMVVVTGTLIIFFALNIPNPSKNYDLDKDGFLNMSFRIPLFLILGFIFISVTASGYFAALGQKPRAISELMTPASIFEKFLCGIFYTAILSIFTYLILFYLTDLAFTQYLETTTADFKLHGSSTEVLNGARTLYREVLPSKGFFYTFSPFPFLVTSIFMLGSVYFNRFHYIKTAVSVMIFSGICFYIVYKTASLLTRNMVFTSPMRHSNKDAVLILVFLITAALTLIFWVITYIRLKEKEV